MHIESRARIHAALGDPLRLAIVESLRSSDASFSELAALVGGRGNLLAHHLDVLREAGLVTNSASEGDGRRRHWRLDRHLLHQLAVSMRPPNGSALFVCTHNSARSQFAAAAWAASTGRPAWSAGTHPASEVHPKAVAVATEFGIDLSSAQPRGYDAIDADPEIVVSVCDRARESKMPEASIAWHWSIADPVRVGSMSAFRSAFADIEARIHDLARDPEEGSIA